MKIRPPRGKVLVRLNLEPEKSRGGILLPESTRRDKRSEGTVLAVGLGRIAKGGKVIPPPVAVGEVVIMPEYGSVETKPLHWEGEGEGRLVTVKTDDLLGVIEQ